jgi:hypothetical protein
MVEVKVRRKVDCWADCLDQTTADQWVEQTEYQMGGEMVHELELLTVLLSVRLMAASKAENSVPL